MKLVMTVCDVCEDKDAPTKRYEIRSEGCKVSVDLCAAHGQPFEGYLDTASTRSTRSPQKSTQARRRPARKVTSMEEIEKMKSKS